jgi:hypothetical protein
MQLEIKEDRDAARNLIWGKVMFLDKRMDDHTRSLEEREDDSSKIALCVIAAKLIDSAHKDNIFKKRRLIELQKVKKAMLIKK